MPPRPATEGSSCRATRSADAPALARARPASRCQAARTGAGISSYSAARISGCRNPRPFPDSASTPAARASSTAGIRSVTLRFKMTARSVTAKSTPSRAAARSTSRTGLATKPRRSTMAADSEPGTELAVSAATPVPVMDLGASGQRGAQLSDIQRVACRPARQPQQVAAGAAAGQRGYQVGHRRLAERGQLQPGHAARRPPQRQQLVPLRHRRIIPTSSSGTCPADRASRPHRAQLAGSAHCRSSMTTMTGRTALRSATSASSCSASTAGRRCRDRCRPHRAAAGRWPAAAG